MAALTIFTGALPVKSQHSINKPKLYSGADSTGNKQLIKRHNRKQQKIKQINTVVAASNTNLKVGNSKPRLLAMAKPTDGRLVKDGLVFQQNFTIRSFDMGSDYKISTEASTNFFQETALNHVRSTGLLADGFGSTLQMSKRNLIWVICRLQIEVDCSSSWGDVIQIDTWMYASGKNGWGRDWHVRDLKTGKTLTRATGVYVMMNKTTRRVSKFIEEARKEINPFVFHCDPLIHNNNNGKLPKLDIDKADQVRTGLIAGWTDMDINQHMSHIKFINYVLEMMFGWWNQAWSGKRNPHSIVWFAQDIMEWGILHGGFHQNGGLGFLPLESVPYSVVESHELFAITLEYRKECNRGSVLQSFSRIISNNNNNNNEGMEFDHLLCLEDGQEIIRGRTTWRPKYADSSIEKV